MTASTTLDSARFFTPEQQAALGFPVEEAAGGSTAVAAAPAAARPLPGRSSMARADAVAMAEKHMVPVQVAITCSLINYIGLGAGYLESTGRFDVPPLVETIFSVLLFATIPGAFGARIKSYRANAYAFGRNFGPITWVLSFIPLIGTHVLAATCWRLSSLKRRG